MKTVKEAAKEYGRKVSPQSDWTARNAEISFKSGVEFAQRWISIEDKLPPLNEYVLFKYSETELCVGCMNIYGFYCSPYMPAENDFASIHLLSEVTHWRPIEIK